MSLMMKNEKHKHQNVDDADIDFRDDNINNNSV